MSNLYALAEYSHIFENCAKCLCAMCADFYVGFRACPICYYMKGNAVKKYCRSFCPNGVDWQIKEWYRQDKVIKDPFFNTVFP